MLHPEVVSQTAVATEVLNIVHGVEPIINKRVSYLYGPFITSFWAEHFVFVMHLWLATEVSQVYALLSAYQQVIQKCRVNVM